MRRLLAAGILLLLIAALCLTGTFSARAAYDRLDRLLDECERCGRLDDLDGAVAAAGRLAADWAASEDRLSLFFNHGELDEIGAAIALLEPYAAAGDRALYLGTCRLADRLLRRLCGEEGFRWHSVL